MKQHFVQRAYIELFFQPTEKGDRLFIYHKNEHRWQTAQSGAKLLQTADWQSDTAEAEDGKIETSAFPIIKKLSQGQTQLSQAEVGLVKKWVTLHSNRKKQDIDHFKQKNQNVTEGRKAFRTLDEMWLEHRTVKTEKSDVDLILPDKAILELVIESDTCVMFAAGPKTLVTLPPISKANFKITNQSMSIGELFNRVAANMSATFYIAPKQTKYYEDLSQAELNATRIIQHQQAFAGTLDETVKMLMKLPNKNPRTA